MKNYFILFLGFTICILACSPTSKMINKKAISVDWIIGKWKRIDTEAYEKWVKLNETEYIGVAYNMHDGIAEILENLRISKVNDLWYYEVKHKMNEFKPVLFLWTPNPEANLRFVNEKNDFPQVISYMQDFNGNMSAKISSLDGSKKEVFEFNKVLSQ